MTSTATPPTPGAAIVRRPARVRVLWLVALVVVVAALCAASVAVGSRVVTWDEIVAGLSGSVDGLGPAAVGKRVARTLLALLVGAALGIAGCVMQGVTRNPLADPGILGVNMGASLAVVTGIAWFGMWTYTAFIWTAILGAAVTAVFVYVVASIGRGGATPLKLALAGAATSAAAASFISAVVLPRGDIAGGVRSWQIGGVGGATFDATAQVVPFLVVGALACLLTTRGLNSLALGDDVAAGLGERVAATRAVASLGAVLLCGAATAVAGPIGFVGLIVPHVCRLLVGVDHRWLVPFSALAGAALVLASDIVGRVVARPDEIDVGIITALLGAPVLIAIVRRRKVKEL
ncbi:iron complex transport system permease protein [Pseudoclavibacter chungangensis]|uniref:FecCD family ABC transporter permease n=1 Tax=Pseudoclavibacter chungangensis TaxID=587635 RepID=UPI0015C6A879|nr:iron ABC transporter permease [Pseudoclavibacter chungangensis]NYJ66034.1 iron complex transport system permease protein [Pseudoclavibacter chungangensis]